MSLHIPCPLQVDLRQAESAVFRGNTAVVSGGAIFGDDSSTSFTANEYNHSVAENRFGFCFTIFGNEGHPGDSEVSQHHWQCMCLPQTPATVYCMYVCVSPRPQLLYTVCMYVSPPDPSYCILYVCMYVCVPATVYCMYVCMCLPQTPATVYCMYVCMCLPQTPATVYCMYVCMCLPQTPATVYCMYVCMCLPQTPATVYCMYVCMCLPQTPGRVVFENNFAFGDGLAISAYSLRGCQISNFVPDNIAQFLPIQSDGNNVFNGSSELGTTTTGPSYLFFYGASSSCYKPVGNVTYLLPNCSHSLINST